MSGLLSVVHQTPVRGQSSPKRPLERAQATAAPRRRWNQRHGARAQRGSTSSQPTKTYRPFQMGNKTLRLAFDPSNGMCRKQRLGLPGTGTGGTGSVLVQSVIASSGCSLNWKQLFRNNAKLCKSLLTSKSVLTSHS